MDHLEVPVGPGLSRLGSPGTRPYASEISDKRTFQAAVPLNALPT